MLDKKENKKKKNQKEKKKKTVEILIMQSPKNLDPEIPFISALFFSLKSQMTRAKLFD